MMTSFNEWRAMREAIEQGQIDPSDPKQAGMLARLKRRGRAAGNYLARPFARMAGMDMTRDTTPGEYLGGEMRDMGRQAAGFANKYIAGSFARMAGMDTSRDYTPLQYLGGEIRDMGRQAAGAANYVARPLARMAGWDSSRDTTPLQHLTFRGK